jgi:hypothetical protein
VGEMYGFSVCQAKVILLSEKSKKRKLKMANKGFLPFLIK